MRTLQGSYRFRDRHIGPDDSDIAAMLGTLGLSTLEELTAGVLPEAIRDTHVPEVGEGIAEEAALAELRALALQNKVKRSFIGQGYYGTFTPQVILRNVFENPGWYTSYTPYQPEISQGRLEVLFNFQTMVAELTGLDIANASLLDEGTAAAEAMTLCHRALRGKRGTFLVDANVHPQTLDVLETRAEPLGLRLQSFDGENLPEAGLEDVFGVLLQYPGSNGEVRDFSALAEQTHKAGALLVCATDLLALCALKAPGQLGADVAIGSAQRFGVPLGFGGPHAAFMATLDKYKRNMPGRLVGQSLDADGRPAYRLALQTREQHIRREKATSNICTAQALLAVMATLYACYHGPDGLRNIAARVHRFTSAFAAALEGWGYERENKAYFDTLTYSTGEATAALYDAAAEAGFNLRLIDEDTLGLSFDETTSEQEVLTLLGIFAAQKGQTAPDSLAVVKSGFAAALARTDKYLSQACFSAYHSETEMMRYLRRLADKDLALDRAMIPLGSCTMKLNAAAEMAPLSWPEFTDIHPFVPADQSAGYREMIRQVEAMLCEVTGYDGVSLQPNAGSQGEYAGLLAIMRYHRQRGQGHRNICLIPSSAHGTNPASAHMAGLKVVVVACDKQGNVDLDDLRAKIDKHGDTLAAIMITYPSTHGVFEARVREVCEMVREAGGQVYIDGANLNAMVGIANPGHFGGDVSHLNLHKTFCIPHGGGGPGVGPVAVGEHLRAFLPGHACTGSSEGVVSSAPWGSAMILPITWMYIRMMGGTGLRKATQVAILNANYIARRLSAKYPILYTGNNGFVAHECILDTRKLKDDTGITVDDIAKRLIDYGFHAPTMSFPVPGTLMVEPTESESREELDRFCDAMLAIYEEAQAVKNGSWPADDNPLVHAPHTAQTLIADQWEHAYPRRLGGLPEGVDAACKYWPPVSRVDNVYGDKNLICSCPPVSDYQD
ncbi:aminomethyl-transferring glycine dehydrogenase [Granulosicoccaceae sp. 1_MG-2023]|nr:aminomethyl-transferring glycine dehydrogenase [Granulosicoccaceae sp. 1_MG-2023]